MKNTITRILLPLLFTTAMIPSSSFGETVVSDDFSLQDRSAEQLLDGALTEVGETQWKATKNLVLVGDGSKGSVAVVDDGGFQGRVAISGAPDVIVAEAKLSALPFPENGWIALGIGNPPLGSPPWGLGVYVRIAKGGHFDINYSGNADDWASRETISLFAGAISEFDPDGSVSVKLMYDAKALKISVWINGVPVLEKFDVADRPIDAAVAGFSGYQQPPGTKIADDFILTTKP